MTKTVDQPKITVNKLGEFLVSSPKRQRSILEALKYPSDNKFLFTGYNDARKAINDYIINDFDERILIDMIEKLESLVGDEKDNFTDSSIKALTIVLESNTLSDSGFTFLPYDGDNPKMTIEGVEISVYPDFIVNYESRGNEYIGAAKVHLSRSGRFGDEGAKYISTILSKFTQDHIDKSGRTVKNTACVSYDVFTDSLIDCPKSIVRRWQDIEAGCKNIVAIWDSI